MLTFPDFVKLAISHTSQCSDILPTYATNIGYIANTRFGLPIKSNSTEGLHHYAIIDQVQKYAWITLLVNQTYIKVKYCHKSLLTVLLELLLTPLLE
jgi:hypothetical protein